MQSDTPLHRRGIAAGYTAAHLGTQCASNGAFHSLTEQQLSFLPTIITLLDRRY